MAFYLLELNSLKSFIYNKKKILASSTISEMIKRMININNNIAAEMATISKIVQGIR
jgi:hypothetical protein